MITKKKPTKKQLDLIMDSVTEKLGKIDLRTWQEACKSLAPPNYDQITRSKWFDENKFRVAVGRDIVEFVDDMTTTLQKEIPFSNIRVSDIRSAVVKGVRRAEQHQKLSKYLLNDVKLAALRTIVGWVDHPERMNAERRRLEKGPRRGRKKEKGKHRPPEIDIIKELEILNTNTIRITSIISNNYIHPYQNVELEIDFGPHLLVTNVSPFTWKPTEKTIPIGYLEAGLGVDPLDTEFTIDLIVQKRVKAYNIECKIHFDNCDRGAHATSKISKATINIY